MNKGMMKYHLLVLFREPLNLFFGLALPFIMMFAFTNLNEDAIATLNVNLAAWILVTAMVLCFMDAAFSHAYSRQTKFLRTLRMTPLTTKRYIVTGIFSRIGILLVFAVALIGTAVVAFDLPLDAGNLAVFAGFLLFAFIMFYLIAMFVANALKGAKPSQSLLYVAFFGMLLIGFWIPLQVLPQVMQDVLGFLPSISAWRVLQAAWSGESVFAGHYLITMGVYTLVFGVLSVKFFKYE